MTAKNGYIISGIVIVILILLAIIVSNGAKFVQLLQTHPTTTIIHTQSVDTVFIRPATDTIWTHPKTVYRDRIVPVYIDTAFSKIIDTTISETQLYVRYDFPEDTVNIRITPPPIKYLFVRDTVRTIEYQTLPDKSNATTHYIIGGSVGMVLGFVIDRLLK